MTFSICVREAGTPPTATDASDENRDERKDENEADGPTFGVAVATQAPAVGALCPFVTREGAIATQAFVNVAIGRRGVELLDDMAVDDVVDGLLAQDDTAENRQVHGVDARGNTVAYTGEGTDGWSGHEVDEAAGVTVTVAGNMLTNGPETLDAVATAYHDADGPVDERLLVALEAGVETGGDKRGHSSAALAVSASESTAYHNLRVDHAEDPITELRRVRDAAKDYADEEGFSEDEKKRSFD